ncbi:hypothetical protein, partial [Paenibacillus ginsengihumi]|uniref:hypothetical protein n=1 Tax=Paenibacillus ginsengihumi TaxID=431596 RepID=UPI001B7F8DEE
MRTVSLAVCGCERKLAGGRSALRQAVRRSLAAGRSPHPGGGAFAALGRRGVRRSLAAGRSPHPGGGALAALGRRGVRRSLAAGR